MSEPTLTSQSLVCRIDALMIAWEEFMSLDARARGGEGSVAERSRAAAACECAMFRRHYTITAIDGWFDAKLAKPD